MGWYHEHDAGKNEDQYTANWDQGEDFLQDTLNADRGVWDVESDVLSQAALGDGENPTTPSPFSDVLSQADLGQ